MRNALTQPATGMIDLFDPTGELAITDLAPAERRSSLAGGVLGVLDNSMGFSNVLLDELAAILQRNYGVAAVIQAQRPSLSRPTPAKILDDLVARSDFIVTGCGV